MAATPSNTTPPHVMDDVLARHFTAEAAQDRSGILATLTNDAEHEPVAFAGAPFYGHDESMRSYEVLFDELEQQDVQPIRRLHGPNFVVDEVQYRGRALRDFMGFDSGTDGRPVDFRLLQVRELDGNRISREQVWLDVNAIHAQAS